MCKKIMYLLKRWIARKQFVGEINGDLFAKPIYINSKKFGKSTKYPTILEVKVNKNAKSKLLDDVGIIVRNKFFDFDFIFNVCFSCSKPRLFYPDKYADPFSIWFNVFLGYYEIDIAESKRAFPFGFDKDFNVNPMEIAKIAKSDWNYFSNFMYGVPLEDIGEDVNKILHSEIDNCIIEDELIHGVTFKKVTMPEFKVISAYEANNDKTLNKEENNFLWQTLFGYPRSRRCFSKSFIATNMKAVMYMYHKDMENDPDMPVGEIQHSTFIFGATINLDYPENAQKDPKNKKTIEELKKDNDEFLELQIEEVKKIIPHVLNI